MGDHVAICLARNLHPLYVYRIFNAILDIRFLFFVDGHERCTLLMNVECKRSASNVPFKKRKREKSQKKKNRHIDFCSKKKNRIQYNYHN